MTERDAIAGLATAYLKRGGGYVPALSALLADLGRAYDAGRTAECDRLIDAMYELRVICGAAPAMTRTDDSAPWRQTLAPTRAA
jgi:hypothetical protein